MTPGQRQPCSCTVSGAPVEMPRAWLEVMGERIRQVAVEGWMPEHDNGELARAAGCYAWIAAQSDGLRDVFITWPAEWTPEWWKPTDRRRDLVKAGALILAEIERLDRFAGRQGDA